MSKVKTAAELVAELRLPSRLSRLVTNVTDAEARAALGRPVGVRPGSKEEDLTGIAFDGYDLRGRHRGTYQVRLAYPLLDDKGDPQGRYCSRSNRSGRWINTTPGKLQARDLVIVVESVKSTLAITASAARTGRKHVKVVDTNGISGWRQRDEKSGVSQPLPDLMLLRDHAVYLAHDSNVRPARPELVIQAQQLETYLLDEVAVAAARRIVIPYEEGVNGPDDYLAKFGDEAWWRLFDAAEETWTTGFPAVADFAEADLKTELLLDGLIAAETVTVLASPSENYKTMLALCLCASLLSGRAAFGHFKVRRQVKGVLYCCPDMSQNLLVKYARYFGLDKFPNFRIRTMAQGEVLGPQHRYIREAARANYYICFDTMNYFTGADDDNNPLQLNKFVMNCRALIGKQGSPGIMLLSHPTKTGARASEVEVTEWVAGTYAKIGSVDTIFCVKKLLAEDGITPVKVYVTREKSRPFDGVALPPFTLALTDGRGSCIERGEMPLLEANAGPLSAHLLDRGKAGRKPTSDKEPKKEFISAYLAGCNGNAPSAEEVKRALDAAEQFKGTRQHDVRTIRRWMKEVKESEKLGARLAQKAMGGGNGNDRA